VATTEPPRPQSQRESRSDITATALLQQDCRLPGTTAATRCHAIVMTRTTYLPIYKMEVLRGRTRFTFGLAIVPGTNDGKLQPIATNGGRINHNDQ